MDQEYPGNDSYGISVSRLSLVMSDCNARSGVLVHYRAFSSRGSN